MHIFGFGAKNRVHSELHGDDFPSCIKTCLFRQVCRSGVEDCGRMSRRKTSSTQISRIPRLECNNYLNDSMSARADTCLYNLFWEQLWKQRIMHRKQHRRKASFDVRDARARDFPNLPKAVTFRQGVEHCRTSTTLNDTKPPAQRNSVNISTQQRNQSLIAYAR